MTHPYGKFWARHKGAAWVQQRKTVLYSPGRAFRPKEEKQHLLIRFWGHETQNLLATRLPSEGEILSIFGSLKPRQYPWNSSSSTHWLSTETSHLCIHSALYHFISAGSITSSSVLQTQQPFDCNRWWSTQTAACIEQKLWKIQNDFPGSVLAFLHWSSWSNWSGDGILLGNWHACCFEPMAFSLDDPTTINNFVQEPKRLLICFDPFTKYKKPRKLFRSWKSIQHATNISEISHQECSSLAVVERWND